VAGRVVAVAAHGVIKIETAPARSGRGEEASEVKSVRLTDQTEVVYSGVGPDGAKPTEGYWAQVWTPEGSDYDAARVISRA